MAHVENPHLMPQEGCATDVELADNPSGCAETGTQLDPGMKDGSPGVTMQHVMMLPSLHCDSKVAVHETA